MHTFKRSRPRSGVNREAIAAVVVPLHDKAKLLRSLEGGGLFQAEHNGFKVWFWEMEPGWWAGQVRDANLKILAKVYFRRDGTYITDKCAGGEWRVAFTAPAIRDAA